MTPQHHPNEATLIAHAAGGLSEYLALVIATHLDYCDACRLTIAAAEAIGGVLLDEIAPEEVSAHTRARVVSRLASAWSFDSPPQKPRVSWTAYFEEVATRSQWRWLARGVEHVLLVPESAVERGTLRLVRAAPGQSLPTHGHGGSELTLVLAGSFADAVGQFRVGDLAELDSNVVHRPVADRVEGCLCLLASDAPARPVGWLARTLMRWSDRSPAGSTARH